MTQEDFAQFLGGRVTRGAVGNWERDKGIKRENIQLVADRAGEAFEWVATGRGQRARNSHEEQIDYIPEPDRPPLYNGDLEPSLIEIGGTEFAAVPRYDASLSAGTGAIIDPDAEPMGFHLIERQWLASVT